jgi:dihydrofolate synthase/folylpolyglutamate synthase
MTTVEEAYQNALDYLYSFVDFSMQKSVTYSPDRFKLERMQTLLASLGNPQDKYPVVHVAGTKGKGSVCILCTSALIQAGYKVGLYTSPHLDDYAERIQINNEFIPHADFAALVDEIKLYVAAIPELTTFEITTALAFLYFARQNIEAGVIEVGLGGRLDATNVVKPKVSVITSLSYDHTMLLGETLTQIAGEKAGIIKTGIPVVNSPQTEEAQLVIERVAKEHFSPLIQVGRDWLFEPVSHSLEGQTLRVWSSVANPESSTLLSTSLLGAHQLANAATAYATLQVARQQGIKINEKNIHEGFSRAFWPGRFEIVQHTPPVILDCAHNRDSAAKLCLTLEEYYPEKSVVLIFGASEDKDIQGMLDELMPKVTDLITVKSFHPRAIDPDKLVEMAKNYNRSVHCVEHIPEAIEKALQTVGKGQLVVITGSIFVVAEARKFWEQKSNIRRY